MAPTLYAPRLTLVPATVDLIDAALSDSASLSAALDAVVPATWPPEYVDEAAFQFTAKRLRDDPSQDGWWMYFILLTMDGSRTLIGTGGYKGPPGADGQVEIGYAIVSEHHRRGFATESAQALLKNAFGRPDVAQVIAETLPELVGSIGVLLKSGFHLVGEGSEPGVIRYLLKRTDWLQGLSSRNP